MSNLFFKQILGTLVQLSKISQMFKPTPEQVDIT